MSAIEGRFGTYQTYDEYLRSDEWRARRALALKRADGRCQVCNSPHRLQVHHRTYAHVGDENWADLTVLCDDCHAWFHVPRTERLIEEGAALARQAGVGEALDARRVAMHLARSRRMDRAGG